ncbi:hypothetical protein FNV43_RR20138 [Rhamnella rubrinervis]|uniref:Ubiquitin carboxyl-terminal hydrolase n=1 Tax=Rhamnella rubrinervis TaxID=2594499 RepID=A0A8K0E0X5_9ROSA|nr:hypothetical protein FNV43_RR20138 [Rhamnella rubrinervis]
MSDSKVLTSWLHFYGRKKLNPPTLATFCGRKNQVQSSSVNGENNDVKYVETADHSSSDDVDSPSFQFQNEDGFSNKFSHLKLQHGEQNGSVGNLSVSVSMEELKNASNGPLKVSRNLLPRGLENLGNLCFLNATLQALLSCSPFVQLLQELRARNIPKVGYPTLTAFAEFVSEFDMPSGGNLKKKETSLLEIGTPFHPAMFEVVLKNFTPEIASTTSGRPRQEDAQEFLSFIMNRMHEELLNLEGKSSSISASKSSVVSSAEDDEWETVAQRTDLQSVVKARGNKASATVEPFLLLPLDIYPDAVRTVEDALKLFCAPETLEGYRPSATGKAGVVAARKSIKIQSLSKIMILQLMRFSYGTRGSSKLHKPVRFPLEFVLGRELLVSPSTEGRKYELVATITHHGREHSKGHYSADARCSNGQWLRFDDASVTAISTSKRLSYNCFNTNVSPKPGLGLLVTVGNSLLPEGGYG